MLTFLVQKNIIYLKKILNRSDGMGLAETFKALSEPVRRHILELLKNGKMTAGEIAEETDMTPAALSYHLKLLKNADLVMEYKQKNFIYYELNTSVLDELILWTKQFGKDGAERNNKMITEEE